MDEFGLSASLVLADSGKMAECDVMTHPSATSRWLLSVTIRQELHVVSVLMMSTSDQVHDSEVQRHQFTDEL